MVEEGELGLDEGKHLTMTVDTTISWNSINMQYHHTHHWGSHRKQFETLQQEAPLTANVNYAFAIGTCCQCQQTKTQSF